MHWKNSEERSDGRAVSPVIGVIMMVAVTVILAAVVSMLVLGMGQGVDNKAQASFTFDYDADATTLDIYHDGGDKLDGSSVTVMKNGASVTTSWSDDPIRAGASTNISASPGDTIKVVWEGPEGDTATLATYEVPS